ncbi:MAG: CcmD family protein [Chloroflexi bacterium]|nr:CcmD family protein [Chloroflexota bacterium]
MSGITAVYVAFSIVIAAIFGYTFLLGCRQRDVEAEIQDLKAAIAQKKSGT